MTTYELRIPGQEQYSYVNITTDSLEEFEEAKQNYYQLKSIPSEKLEGLDTKNFQRALDKYLVESTITMEDYDKMSLKQREQISELKKAFSRIKNKNQ